MTEQNGYSLNGGKKQCVRVGKAGDRTVESREADVVEMWTRFNKDFRPDNALFVEGTCLHLGRYTKAECDAIGNDLKASVSLPGAAARKSDGIHSLLAQQQSP